MINPETPTVTIQWSPADLMYQYGYSQDDAIELLDSIAGTLQDRSIELGWEVIDSLIRGK